MNTSPPQDDFSLLAFAHRLADAASGETLPRFRRLSRVENKLSEGFDPVTQADRAAEKAMRQLIEEHYPEHAILGEEFGIREGGDLQWVLDPIDGTRAFISGMPSWGTLIGLNDRGVLKLGIMDQPFTGERYVAARGGGGCLHHRGSKTQLKTRACSSLETAILASTSPDLFTGKLANLWRNIARAVRLVRYGGDCYNYALIAAGQIDAVIEPGLNPYDIQALIPIIEEAGGVVTNWHGEAVAQGGNVLATGDRQLHDILLTKLA